MCLTTAQATMSPMVEQGIDADGDAWKPLLFGRAYTVELAVETRGAQTYVRKQ